MSEENTKIKQNKGGCQVSPEMLCMAITSFSDELAKILDLGEALDLVNKYLWELVDYTASIYIIYNYATARFETRTYLKESVSSTYVENMRDITRNFLIENAAKMPVGAAAEATKDTQMLLYGVKPDESNSAKIKESFIAPLAFGDNFVGALHITSQIEEALSVQNKKFIEVLLKIAAISIARIQTFLQTQNSGTEALVQSISNGVIMFDNSARVTLANDMAMRFTGLPKEGYDLKELTRLFPDINLFAKVEEALDTDKVIKISRAGISNFWYEIAVLPVKNYREEIIGGAIVLHDITHIVEVDKAKTEFVSLASHQLRTPLAAIRWYTEMLLSEDQGALSPQQRDLLEVVDTSNKRMIQLVNSLLNVSRIELGTFAVDPVQMDMANLTKSIITELNPKIRAKSATVVEDYDESFEKYMGDPSLVRIIIQNLLSNAIKYSKPKGEVRVSIKKDPNDDKMLRIQVEDHGLGIPKAQQPLIFTKLFRADNAKVEEPDGNGLGLYIIQAIIREVDGRIWFESKENEGTTFYVQLPLQGMSKKMGSKPLETKTGT